MSFFPSCTRNNYVKLSSLFIVPNRFFSITQQIVPFHSNSLYLHKQSSKHLTTHQKAYKSSFFSKYSLKSLFKGESAFSYFKRNIKLSWGDGPQPEWKEFKLCPNGKLFCGLDSPTLISYSTLVPKIRGSTLGNNQTVTFFESPSSSYTLLIVSVRRIYSKEMVNSWKKECNQQFPNLEVLEINLPDEFPYKQIESLNSTYYKNEFSSLEQANSFVIAAQDEYSENFKKELKIRNPLTPFVFLVDTENYIRWRGVGSCTSQDLKALHLVLHILG